jgi:hypothetical protein
MVLNSKRRKWKVAVGGFNENTKTGNGKKSFVELNRRMEPLHTFMAWQ